MKHVKLISRAQEVDPRIQAILDTMVGQLLQLLFSIAMIQNIKTEPER